jgi:predicted TIM-barrel fold metal-dependent hydrolase
VGPLVSTGEVAQQARRIDVGPVVQRGDEFATMNHDRVLKRAAEQAAARRLQDYFIVDIDVHYNETASWFELLEYLDDEVLYEFLRAGGRGTPWIPAAVRSGGSQDASGRIKPQRVRDADAKGEGAAGFVRQIRDTIDALSVDKVIIFPTEFLHFGTNPFVNELEAPLALAHARWVTERLLGGDPRIITQLYLPFSDPQACLDLIEQFGDHPGVVGFMVTSVRYRPVHDPAYFPVYRALEERGLPLGFHGAFHYYERSMEQFNRFISVHALGFPHYQMINMTNWVINGLPERFPDLRLIFIEGGLAFIPFLMERLDHEFLARPSEAPLLKRRPSEYMREFFYSSQPLESAINPRYLEVTFEMINARSQLMYASDWPHWDFDLPSRIFDIPFLDEEAKRNILGLNAARVYGLDPTAGAMTAAADEP